MKHIFLLSLAALAVLSPSLHAQVIFSDNFNSDPGVSIINTRFIEGTHSTGTYYSTGVNSASWQNSGGVGGTGWMSVGLYGDGLVLGLPAPVSSQTWTIDFEWQSTNSFGSTIFSVWGLTAGQEVGLTGTGVDGGNATNLFSSSPIANTSGVWTSESFDVTIPTGYSVILLKWGHNLDTPRGGIDNLVVSIPEPSTAALLLGGVFGLLWLRSRRCKGVSN